MLVKAKVATAVLGTEFIQFHAAANVKHQDDLKKRMNNITYAWQNGRFRKMEDHLDYTTPNHHPPKMNFLPKFFSSNHPCCWMTNSAFKYVPQTVLRRPLPSVCFFFYGGQAWGWWSVSWGQPRGKPPHHTVAEVEFSCFEREQGNTTLVRSHSESGSGREIDYGSIRIRIHSHAYLTFPAQTLTTLLDPDPGGTSLKITTDK